jgi:siderophore synthetase component
MTSQLKTVLNSENWHAVCRDLLTKMIREFTYESILSPQPVDEDEQGTIYALILKNGIRYTFTAQKRVFDSIRVLPETIQREASGRVEPAYNPIQFLLDIQTTVGISSETTGHLMRELYHTLLADAHIREKKQQHPIDLTQLDYAELEGAMEGHPWITYNKGRIGFGYQDYLAYAPERQQPVTLDWIAVHKNRADFHAVDGLDYSHLIRQELGEEQVRRYQQALQDQEVNPAEYRFLPIHEWQWDRYIVPLFAEDLAQKRILPLGRGPDQYLPQQSIRTFVNCSHPKKHHVKLPMSILNTLVYRGLPGERTVLAPKITQYIKQIQENDPFLHEECRVILPGEIASINVDHPYYANLPGAPYQYLEMLGCIWRESIYDKLEEGEKPVTLASLLHLNHDGRPLVLHWVKQSGLQLEDWLKRLFSVLLPPLLHFLYRYGVVFSPHGQNTILVLKDSIPHRLAMKDFVDDVNVSDQPLPELADLSTDLKAVLRSEPPEGLCQFIFTGLFICHFRYLSDLLETHEQYPEALFWSQVRTTILRYQERFVQWRERYALFDLLRPRFTKLCLNRNRILDYGYGDDDDRPHASEHGTVTNVLAEANEVMSP